MSRGITIPRRQKTKSEPSPWGNQTNEMKAIKTQRNVEEDGIG